MLGSGAKWLRFHTDPKADPWDFSTSFPNKENNMQYLNKNKNVYQNIKYELYNAISKNFV